MKKLYYAEFVVPNSSEPYVMQSKWFSSKRKVKNWLKNSFDFVSNSGDIEIYIMSAPFDEDDIMGDIETEEEFYR